MGPIVRGCWTKTLRHHTEKLYDPFNPPRSLSNFVESYSSNNCMNTGIESVVSHNQKLVTVEIDVSTPSDGLREVQRQVQTDEVAIVEQIVCRCGGWLARVRRKTVNFDGSRPTVGR